MEQKFLSIVVPIYNAETYLSRCLDSILNQGMGKDDIEVLLVNDGSTDGSLEICEEYKRRNPDVFTIITQENSGVAVARNTGIENACGKYITFVDADDCLVTGGYRWLIDSFYDESLDKLMFWMITIDKHTSADISIKGKNKNIQPKVTTGHEFLCNNFDFSVCHSLYRRSFLLVNSIRFGAKQRIAEDVLFNLRFDLCNPKIKIVPQRLYLYYVNSGSAVVTRSEAHCRRMVEDYLYLLLQIRAFAVSGKYSEKLNQHLIEIGQGQLIPMTSRILSSNLSCREFIEIRDRLIDNGFLPLNSKNKTTLVLSLIYQTPYLLKIYQFLFRGIFQRFVLPYLKRN